MNRAPYEYAVLRVVPRVDRGEFINAGVVLYCQQHDFLGVTSAFDPDRARALDPRADVAAIADALAAVVAAADDSATGSLGVRFRWLTAPRSTVVQPGPVHTGMTSDPQAELERLRERLLPALSSPVAFADDDDTSELDRAERVRRAAITVGALAQDGLAFSRNPFDIDRFQQLRTVAADLFATLSGRPATEFELELGREVGYVTPKIEVRGGVVDEQDRLLMMRERLDGRWSLPGGFADPLDTPSEAVIREIREETGYGAAVVKLVAVWDRDTQGHRPKFPIAMWKLFFLCRLDGAQEPPKQLETLDVGWFALDQLPELSTGRVLPHELARIVAHHHDPSLPTELD